MVREGQPGRTGKTTAAEQELAEFASKKGGGTAKEQKPTLNTKKPSEIAPAKEDSRSKRLSSYNKRQRAEMAQELAKGLREEGLVLGSIPGAKALSPKAPEPKSAVERMTASFAKMSPAQLDGFSKMLRDVLTERRRSTDTMMPNKRTQDYGLGSAETQAFFYKTLQNMEGPKLWKITDALLAEKQTRPTHEELQSAVAAPQGEPHTPYSAALDKNIGDAIEAATLDEVENQKALQKLDEILNPKQDLGEVGDLIIPHLREEAGRTPQPEPAAEAPRPSLSQDFEDIGKKVAEKNIEREAEKKKYETDF